MKEKPNGLKIFCFSGKRAKEKQILENIEGHELVEFQLNLRKRFFYSLFSLFNSINRLVYDKIDVLLLDYIGVFALPLALIAKKKGIKIVSRVKGDPNYEVISKNQKNLFKKLYIKISYYSYLYVLNNSEIILPLSGNLISSVKNVVNKDKKICVLGIPYSKDHFLQSKNTLSKPKNGIVTVTNFNFWDKVSVFIESVPIIYSILQKHNLKWEIYGGGNFFEQIVDQLPQFKFLFKGQADLETLSNAYSKSIAMIYLSRMDALPNTFLEAGLYRLPIIVNSDCPAIEFVLDEFNGLHLDLRDPEQMDRIMKEFMSFRHNELGENNYHYVTKNFSPKVLAKRLELMLDNIN